jgi:hypothetical protein
MIKLLGKIMKEIKVNVIDKLKSEAAKEIQKEFEDDAKAKIKRKMKDLEVAKKIVANLERELEDLYVELSQD